MSPRSSPHSPKPLFDVRMMLPRSYLAETRVKNAVAASPVIGPDAELVHDEDLGSQVAPQSAVQVVLGPGLPEVFHQVVGADEVGPVPVLDGFLGQCHRQVSFAYSSRS